MVEKKKKPKFLRKDWHKKSKLGKRRKKKQKWVKPRGRHNKLREKRKGHGKIVCIGYSQAKEIRGKIQNLKPVFVSNVSDIKSVNQGEIAIFASVGKKNKIAMAEKCKELGIKVNFNLEIFLEKARKEFEERKVKRKQKEKSVKEKEKKAEKKQEKPEIEGEEKKEQDKKEKEKMLMKPVEKDKLKVEMSEKKAIVKRKALEK